MNIPHQGRLAVANLLCSVAIGLYMHTYVVPAVSDVELVVRMVAARTDAANFIWSNFNGINWKRVQYVLRASCLGAE